MGFFGDRKRRRRAREQRMHQTAYDKAIVPAQPSEQATMVADHAVRGRRRIRRAGQTTRPQ